MRKITVKAKDLFSVNDFNLYYFYVFLSKINQNYKISSKFLSKCLISKALDI